MRMPEKQGIIKYFSDLYDKYGYDFRSLDWKDPAGQTARYSVLFDIVGMLESKPKLTLADIGCGLGHYYGFLKDTGRLKKYNIDYTGYDINPKLIGGAKEKYPEARFAVKDILEGYFTEKFDHVAACGIFNIKLGGEAEHLEFVKEMLQRMYECSKAAVAVNFLSINGASYVAGAEGGGDGVYYYFKPEEIVQFARSFCQRYILRHDYHLGDFTIYLIKEER